MRSRSLALALTCTSLLGCAADPAGMRLDERISHPSATPIAPHTECTVITYREPSGPRDHRTPCSALDYASIPPAGGPHYGQWAAFGVYAQPVPWGFLVHSLEHGAVVLAHACEGAACPEVTAALEAMVARDDALCRLETTPSRVIVTPSPGGLSWPIAAVAWEHVYLATCLDEPSLREFVDAHYGRAPEDLCVPGVDLSATGWCE